MGIPKSWVKMVNGMGADVLIGELRGLKLTRYLGGSKLNQLGYLYSEVGVQLRICQTDTVPDDLFAEGVRNRREWADRPWRYEDYSA